MSRRGVVMVDQDRCFSKSGLAEYLSKSTRWIDNLLRSSSPPPGFKVGKSWIFKKSEIDLWLEGFRAGTDLDELVQKTLADLRG
jgi:predicted DNA-binding transcriptional regulator AlpA